MTSTPHGEAVRELLRTLATTWPRAYGTTAEAKAATLTTWRAALAGVPASVLPEVAQRLTQTSKYAPKPSEALSVARSLTPRMATRTVGYSPGPTTADVVCVTCGTTEPRWMLAVPIGSRTGVARDFCACEVERGHAVTPAQWAARQTEAA